MTLIVVEVDGAAAPAGRCPGDLAEAARRADVQVQQLHPGVDDPALASWFAITLPPDRTAAGVLDALRSVPSVTAAYEKPPDAAP